MRFVVIHTVIGKGGGAVGNAYRILDTHGKEALEYTSGDFDHSAYRYLTKKVQGQWDFLLTVHMQNVWRQR